ncbi:ABC transporter, periplasmic substrate-binding protein [Candidatus Phaeomarinobacter ectocarpi]|uniref:ABC transporter, periplasmic substrate-binding protein n=2 Tax=Candidatus Phaeomarinibacter ectocarpi TaxID=1458461 RepID=X5MAW9_9HYPH|nr:ABC transporter, periplasmic substrate-binding protein [Candidatus Phaeomarinobacter ectocarpi]
MKTKMGAFMVMRRMLLTLLISLAGSLVALASAQAQTPQHGIAMHGSPKYPADFTRFDYVNDRAPQEGEIKLAAIGGFDSLNPMIIRGSSAAGIRWHVFESLMGRAYDEPFSLYGLIAETITTPDDRSWVEFTLRPEARFSDGQPVTVEDVIFTVETLRDQGRPNHKFYYGKVASMEKTGDRKVRLTFTEEGDREMPLIMGLMPILPKHVYEGQDFTRTGLTPMIGSGPYTIGNVDPGSSITFLRNPDYWGKDVPAARGHNNFDRIRYDYFRDANASFEAFKSGEYTLRIEDDPTRWSTGYDVPAVKDGRIIREQLKKSTPSGMRALVFNTRRDVFSDINVRKALGMMFDFEWINKNLFYGLYTRTQSFYDNSELSSAGRPASPAEKALLAPFPDAVTPEIMASGYVAPRTDGSGRNRSQMRDALALLKEAGYTVQDAKLVDASGAQFAFEILVASPEDERLALTFARNLERLGIDAKIRNVDSSQYQQRRQTYDYDMIFNFWSASLSPGNEQSFYWGGDSADTDGTRNYMGVRSDAVDAMIAAMLEAREREDFVTAVRALDRVLLSGHYVIPLYHAPDQWVARWNNLDHPQVQPNFVRFDTWWSAGTN